MTEIKTVKISGKGQISIPKGIRKDLKLKEGETLVMISVGGKIILEKPEKLVKNIRNEGKKTMLMSENSLKKDWDNKYDERWDKY